MLHKLLCIVKFGIALLISLGSIGQSFTLLTGKNRNIVAGELTGEVIFMAMCGILVYYLVRTAIWNWANQTYKRNVIFYIGIFLQIFLSIFLQFYGDFGKGWNYIVQAGISLLLFGIATFDAVALIYSDRWKAKKDEELLSELLQDPK